MQMLGGVLQSKMGNNNNSTATAYKNTGQQQVGMSDLMPPNPPTGVNQNEVVPNVLSQQQQPPQDQNSIIRQLMQQYLR